jgi:uncharacterized protein
MKIILAGGTGLIGTAITKSLLEEGHTVVILSRQRIPEDKSRPSALRYARWDGMTSGPWSQHLGGADAVINLSGTSLGAARWTARQKEEILNSRVRPLSVLLEAMRAVAGRPGLLISASGTGYYGHVPEGELDESAPSGQDFLAGVCREWERSAEAAERIGVRVVRLRTAFVIDRRAEGFQRMLTPFRFFSGGWYGRGAQWFPWIHLVDVVRGYLHVLEHPSLTGPVNLVAPEVLRIREFMTMIGHAMGRPAWMPVPAAVLRLVLGEMSDLLLTGQRAVPKKLIESGFVFLYPRATEALSQILHGRDGAAGSSEMGRPR